MSQKSVEILLGKLATDEALRRRFRTDPLEVLETVGLELTAVEVEAVRTLDGGALERFARAVDPRLQKASLEPTDALGGRRRSKER